jgi:hypothetical protein
MATVAFAYGIETIQTRSTNTAGQYEFVITFNSTFWDDVTAQLYNVTTDFVVLTTATPAQMKAALMAAMIAKAAELGMTLVQANISNISFSKG